MQRLLATILLAASTLAGCAQVSAPPRDDRCPGWLQLRVKAIAAEGNREFSEAAGFAGRSAAARLACDASGAEKLTPEARARIARDLLHAGQFAHQAGDSKTAVRLVREAEAQYGVAIASSIGKPSWLADADFDLVDAKNALERDEWPRFDEPHPAEMN